MTMYERISETGFVIGRFDPKDELPEPSDAVISKVDWDLAFNNVNRAASIAGDQRTMRENRRKAREAADPASEYRKMREARVRREQARRATKLSPSGAIAQAMPKTKRGKAALALTAAVPIAVVNRKAISALNEKRKDARANRPASLYYDDAVGKALDFLGFDGPQEIAKQVNAGGPTPEELKAKVEAQRAATAAAQGAATPPAKKAATPRKRAAKKAAAPGTAATGTPPAKKTAAKKTTATKKTAASGTAPAKKTAAKKTTVKVNAPSVAAGPAPAPAPTPAPTPAPAPAPKPRPNVSGTQFTRTGKILYGAGKVRESSFVRGAGKAGQAALKNPAATGAILAGISGLGAMTKRSVYRAKLAREHAKAPVVRRIPGGAKVAAGGAAAASVLGAMEYANRRAERNRQEARAFGKALPDHLEDIEKGKRLDLIRDSVGRLGQGVTSGSKTLGDISAEATRTAANARQAKHELTGILSGRQKKGIFAPAPRWTGKQIAATGVAVGGGLAAGRYLSGPRPNNYQQQQ